jgi:hypothetical protein
MAIKLINEAKLSVKESTRLAKRLTEWVKNNATSLMAISVPATAMEAMDARRMSFAACSGAIFPVLEGKVYVASLQIPGFMLS